MGRLTILATVLLSAVWAANGQFQHFPVQPGRAGPESGERRTPPAQTVRRPTVPQDLEDEDYNEVELEVDRERVNRLTGARVNRNRGRGRGGASPVDNSRPPRPDRNRE